MQNVYLRYKIAIEFIEQGSHIGLGFCVQLYLFLRYTFYLIRT